MGVSNGTTALGIAVALGEIKIAQGRGRSARTSTSTRRSRRAPRASSSTQAQIVLLGNKAGAGGRYRIGHAVMKDALDIDGIYDGDPQRRPRAARARRAPKT